MKKIESQQDRNLPSDSTSSVAKFVSVQLNKKAAVSSTIITEIWLNVKAKS